jgi:hypothetical protein
MKVESNIDPIDVQTIKSMKVLEYDPVDETFK